MKKGWYNVLPTYSSPHPPVEKLFSSFNRSFLAVALLTLVTATSGAYASNNGSNDHNGNNPGYIANTTVSITDGKDRINAGGNLLYVVKVTQNAGPVRAMNIVMTLPSYTNAAYPDNGGRVVGSRIIWDAISLSQGEEKIFTIQVNLGQTIPLNTVLTASIQADRAVATDTTTVGVKNTGDNFRLSVTDNRDQVYPGQNLSYVITVKNATSYNATTDVSALVSGLNTIDTPSQNAIVNYPTVTWKNVEFGPNEQKTFTFKAAMNKRVAPYTAARVVAHVGLLTATDTTVSRSLHGDPVFMTSTQLNSSTSPSRSSASTTTSRNVLFRHTSDADNVVRGGTIHYTLTVQNVLLNVIRDGVVSVRFDPKQLSVIDTNGGTLIGDNRIQWKLPVLQPGSTWKLTYAMKVSNTLPAGAVITNVASLNGNDVGSSTLSERVTVANADVITNLPATGAAFDLLFALLSAPLALAGTMLQRKLS